MHLGSFSNYGPLYPKTLFLILKAPALDLDARSQSRPHIWTDRVVVGRRHTYSFRSPPLQIIKDRSSLDY